MKQPGLHNRLISDRLTLLALSNVVGAAAVGGGLAGLEGLVLGTAIGAAIVSLVLTSLSRRRYANGSRVQNAAHGTGEPDIVVYTDGSYREEAGKRFVSYGFVAFSDGKELASSSGAFVQSKPGATNNHAERVAIQKALKRLAELNLNKRRIVVRSDSTVVQRGMKKLNVDSARFPKIEFEQVYRQNNPADGLARRSLHDAVERQRDAESEVPGRLAVERREDPK